MSDLLVGPLPKHVLAFNFWLLGAQPNHPAHLDSWYPSNDRPRPIVDVAARLFTHSNYPSDPDLDFRESDTIGHYVLMHQDLEQEDREIAELAMPYAERKHAEIGASFIQALNARRVTVIGEKRWLDEAKFNQLRDKGCMIEEIYGSGTTLASKIAHL